MLVIFHDCPLSSCPHPWPPQRDKALRIRQHWPRSHKTPHPDQLCHRGLCGLGQVTEPLLFFTSDGQCPFSPSLHSAQHHPSQLPLSSQSGPSECQQHVDPLIARCMPGSPPLQPHLSLSCPSFMDSSPRPPSFSSSNSPCSLYLPDFAQVLLSTLNTLPATPPLQVTLQIPTLPSLLGLDLASSRKSSLIPPGQAGALL